MLNLLIKTGYPFASFRFPGKHEFINIVQTRKKPALFSPEELDRVSGFVFAPFDKKGKDPHFIIRHDLSYAWHPGNPVNAPVTLPIPGENSKELSFPDTGREEYIRQIRQVLKEIRKGRAKKVVLSRPRLIRLPEVFDFTTFFTHLHLAYPDAFLFMVFLPGSGIWAGATPELFLEQSSRYLKTVSLAGTLPIGEPGDIPFWDKKEKEEQHIVTEYIRETLHASGFEPAEINGPHTRVAGRMAHLETTINIPFPADRKKLAEIIGALHPTPAICGYPKQAALDIIRETENYNRQYYTGYLGPWNTRYPSRLYVNLRSMQLLPAQREAVLYAGGGITAASDPGKEWNETVMKIQTLLSVLEKMPNFVQ